MSYTGKCKHGVWTHPFEDWQRCARCMEEKKLNDARKDVLFGIVNLTSRRDSEKDLLAGSILANLVKLSDEMFRDERGVWCSTGNDSAAVWENVMELTKRYRGL